MIEKVRSIVGGEVLDTVHNHHNYAWRERHGDRDLWVVRKGATPAFPGQRGFVGGSMGDDAVILSGLDSETAAASFYSTVHGAGRVMSRSRLASLSPSSRRSCAQPPETPAHFTLTLLIRASGHEKVGLMGFLTSTGARGGASWLPGRSDRPIS